MVSTKSTGPILTPPPRYWACGAMLIDSWPPAATMTTSSDMGISWGLSFLKDVGGRRKGGASLAIILLTELRHVNGAAIELCGPAITTARRGLRTRQTSPREEPG